MTDSSHISILRRMAGQAVGAAPASPLTTSRAVRLALVKAATESAGLVLQVASTADDVGRLDDLLAGLDQGLLLVGLDRQGVLAGFVALDMQLRAAVVEVQTTGRLLNQPADDRPATGTDKALCDPLLAGFLTALPSAVTGTAYEGWVDDVTPGEKLADSRLAGLLLADGDYRVLRMTVDLGSGDRRGELLLALPVQVAAPAPEAPAPVVDWDKVFTAAVQVAPASLTARLHRFKMPLGQAQSLQAGQVVPLPGCTVNSVRLIAPDGRCVAQAKLGQLGGYRAVRIELAPSVEMHDLMNETASLADKALPRQTRDQDMAGMLEGV